MFLSVNEIDMEKANVFFVHRKEEQNRKENYRPISLLVSMSKVMEHIKYFIVNKLITERNSGFKQGDSTIKQLIKITHNIYQGTDNHHEVCMLFLDMAKPFDKVYHAGLLCKLKMVSQVICSG